MSLIAPDKSYSACGAENGRSLQSNTENNLRTDENKVGLVLLTACLFCLYAKFDLTT